MKKTLFFMICSLVFIVSCDKLFVHVSGKEAELQGKWQMDNADTVFFNFQNSLFLYQIYLKTDYMTDVYGYYSLYTDSLDAKLCLDIKLLRQYASLSLDHLGWDTLRSETGQDTIFKAFKVEQLTSKKLILESNNEKISFHKF